MSKNQIELTDEQVTKARAFLSQQKFTRNQWDGSYQSWIYGGNGWHILRSGGTNIQQAIAWYQHIHRPGSKEWRPSVIVRAVVEASKNQGAPELPCQCWGCRDRRDRQHAPAMI